LDILVFVEVSGTIDLVDIVGEGIFSPLLDETSVFSFDN